VFDGHRMHHVLQTMVKRLVSSKRRKVRSWMVSSESRLPLAVERCCTLQSQSQFVSMGSVGVQRVVMLAPLASNLCTCDGPIYVVQLCQHGSNGDVSKANGVIIKSSKVQLIDGSENMSFHLFTEGGDEDEFSKGSMKMQMALLI